MPDYQVLGGVFRSSVELPGLTVSPDGAPDCFLRVVDRPPAVLSLEQIGREQAGPDVWVTLSRHPDGFRLAFDDSGVFDVSADGREITWSPAEPRPDPELVVADVMGRALAVALHARGDLALHGSAVAFGRHSVAFVGPKRHGKSTTVRALVDSGADLLADDLVAVALHGRPDSTDGSDTEAPRIPPVVLPGLPVVRLWHDSAARFRDTEEGPAPGTKIQLHLASELEDPSGAALDAVYLLAPVPDEDDVSICRVAVHGQMAALALAGHTKIGSLLDGRERAAELVGACELVDRTEVYRLEVPRNLDRVPELVDTLRRWHDPHAQR